MGPALNIRSVSHRYGDRPALRDVSLEVPPGILLGVLGPNGGGKTTLFRIISTLLIPTEGRVSVFGSDPVASPNAVRRRIGMVFQNPALDAELTIRENAATNAALYGIGGRKMRDRVEALAADFRLTERLDDRVSTLSGGLQRRADLLRGLLHQPELLLLDEPTTGLDPAARRIFWDLLSDLKDEYGTTMIAATHLMEEAEQCDRVAVIDEGRIIAEGRPAELRARLGDESLWLETSDAAALADAVADRFGFETRIVGHAVQVVHGAPYDIVLSLHESFGGWIESATIRRPTLEDVFLHLTGRRIHDVGEQSAPDGRTAATTRDEMAV